MNDNGVALAAIAIVGTTVGALIWIVKFLMMQMRRSLDKNTSAQLKVVQATESHDRYLKDRNGRDMEVHNELLTQMKENRSIFYSTEKRRTQEFEAIMEAIPKTIKKQEVANQVVQVAHVDKMKTGK